MKLLAILLFLLCAAVTDVNAATPAGCESEAGLAARTDIIGCEAWASSSWWDSGVNPTTRWWQDQGDTGNCPQNPPTGHADCGKRFHRQRVSSDDVTHTEITSAGCYVPPCLKVKLNAWNTSNGGNVGLNWVIPGVGGCEHDQAGCTPRQEIYLRYYMKLAPNYDPENYSSSTGEAQGGGGKMPGLSDATNGHSGTISEQCGNGGEGPESAKAATDCWSLRLVYNVPWHTDNGPRNACTETRNYLCTTRFGFYPYLYVPGMVEGTRFTNAYWDGLYSPDNSNPGSGTGVCTDTYGLECGSGDAGLVNGKWYLVEVRVKMNDPGTANGVMEGWLDGVKRYTKTNVNFRGTGHNNIGIRNFWLNMFPGGTGVAMKEDTYVLFDQMVIATDAQVGPWSGTYEGQMVSITPDPATGMAGFARNYMLYNVMPNGGSCYLSVFGTGNYNGVRCLNLQQMSGGTLGVWTTLFSSDNGAGETAAAPNASLTGTRDNQFSAYVPNIKELWYSGGSHIEPPLGAGGEGLMGSGRMTFEDCATSFVANCAKWKVVSRWTTTNTTNNFNASYTGGAGADSQHWVCNYPPCTSVVKNLTFGHGGWRVDNAAAWNEMLRIGMHGWGYNAYDGQHYVWEENISQDAAGRSLCNAGAASGSEAFISCQLSSPTPTELPLYTNSSNCSDIPIGGNSPGEALQGMNILIPGPNRENAFFRIGTRADACQGTHVISRDHWKYNAVTKTWTRLATPPVGLICDTPLYMYHPERSSGILQCDDKIWEYPMHGQDVWHNVTPSGGTGFATFNSSGACDRNSLVCVIQNGNLTGGGGAGSNGTRGFTLSTATILSSPPPSSTAARFGASGVRIGASARIGQ